MSQKALNSKGFSPIEDLLIFVIMAIIGGVSFYVYNANKTVNKTFNNAAKASQGSPKFATKQKVTTPAKGQASTQRYFTIKEWGVRAPIDKSDTLTYRFTGGNESTIEIISKNLADNYGCTDFGAGLISRYTPKSPIASDTIYQTAAQYASSLDKSEYSYVAGYYYFFGHDQAACGSISAGPAGSPTAGEQAQSAANDHTKSLVGEFEAMPQGLPN